MVICMYFFREIFPKIRIFSFPVLVSAMLAACSLYGNETRNSSNAKISMPGFKNVWIRTNPKYRQLAKGPLAGDLGSELSGAAMKQALEAEYRALENSRSGEIIRWQYSDEQNGNVTSFPPYQVGSSNCRRYIHTVSIEGNTNRATGTACRNNEGIWSPLT
ncbi:MAG: hypothetical protein GY742_17530 [Hyphomicrobiales bacterium]|nr:hypothetical protein [Hyphomicrobiales bacterium]